MTTITEIKLSDFFGRSLDTREAVAFLMDKIEKESDQAEASEIVLDFSGIEFMSRSFADELHKQINRESSRLSFIFENLSFDLKNLLKIVEKTQTSRKKVHMHSSVYVINDLTKLKDYTFSW